MINEQKVIELLPYHLQSGENTLKYLKAFIRLQNEILELIEDIGMIGDVESEGVALDLTGMIVNEYRNGETDTDFRVRIKSKIISSISGGEIETLNGFARILLKDAFVGIVEGYSLTPPKPASLTLVYNASLVDFDPLNAFKTVMAGGVSLDTSLQIYVPVFDFYDPSVTNLVQIPILV